MDGVTVTQVLAWPGVQHRSELLELVGQLQSGEPYNYRPDEAPAPEGWFPVVVDRADITLVAHDPAGHPIGYCVALGITGYPDVHAVAGKLGIPAAKTGYLAELGVSARTRRRGVASMLLDRLFAAPPEWATAWLVRTLEINTPAIALYQRYGFESIPAATQILHGRSRVYLVRR